MKHWIVDEICPHCDGENHYVIKGEQMLDRCGDCGKWIVLCDKCVQMHEQDGGIRDCAHCKWCDEAERKNKRKRTSRRLTKRGA